MIEEHKERAAKEEMQSKLRAEAMGEKEASDRIRREAEAEAKKQIEEEESAAKLHVDILKD